MFTGVVSQPCSWGATNTKQTYLNPLINVLKDYPKITNVGNMVGIEVYRNEALRKQR